MNQAAGKQSIQVVGLGAKFIRWGLGLGVFGILLGFGVIGHYLHDAQHPTGEAFLKNMGLWYACPWTLSVYAIQLGSLGMVVYGAVYLILGNSRAHQASPANAGFWLCVVSLIAIFCTGYIGYFIVDKIWPGFYYVPIEAGKQVWLLAQLICIVCYFIGAILVWYNVSKMLRGVPHNLEPTDV
jgi:ABC-type antimicrobial peptide transport system permease subunit